MINLKNKFLSPVSMSLVCLLLMSTNMNLQATEVWVSDKSNPTITVSIHDKKVWIKTLKTLAITKVRAVNRSLLDQHKENYIKIKDFNEDGTKDVGVLDGVGYGGNNKCYSVYEYDPVALTYKNKASFTACPQ